MRHAGENLFIVTGGPGAGKSTLLAAAAAMGYVTVPESGRAILQSQTAIGGRGLHWDDQALYAELMLDREMENHRLHAGSGAPVLFDRGVPDLLGYARLCGLRETGHFGRAAALFRYNRKVFLAPPWREIYEHDAERKQDWDEAVRTYEAISWGYQEAGYEPVELPCVPIPDRLAFLEQEVANA